MKTSLSSFLVPGGLRLLGMAGMLLALVGSAASAQTTVAHDPAGNRASQAAETPGVAPTITAQPTPQLGQVGTPVSFTVVAAGTGPLTYQWFESNSMINGATSSTLVLPSPQSTDFTNHTSGTPTYHVKVTNGTNSVTSNSVALYLDTDGVGIPDWWQLQYFGTIGIAPFSDSDGDGISNYQEYLDGTDPTNATSHNFTLTTTGPVNVQPLQATYTPGTVVTLTVPNINGSYFQNWSGDASGQTNPLSVTMTANKNITAVMTSAITPPTAPLLSASAALGGMVNSVLLQSNGQILAAGEYETLNGRPQWVLGRLNTNGTLDTTFFTGAGNNLPVANTTPGAADMVQQTDGKIIVVGFYATGSVSSIPASIYRVNIDGTLDTTYVASTSTYIQSSLGGQGQVTAVALQSDGKVLIGGSFATVNGVARAGIARLNTDGSLDTTFNPGTGFVQDPGNTSGTLVSARCLKLDSTGRIYVAGTFGTYNGASTPGVARLTSTGAFDTTFNVGTGIHGTNANILSLAIRSTGGVFIGGGNSFSKFNGTTVPFVIALTSTGALDSTFNFNGGFFQASALAILSNGQLLAAAENSIRRLNTDGSTDNTFSLSLGGNGQVFSIALQSNGQIVAGGSFSSADNVPQINIARFNSDGTLDTTAVMNAGVVNVGVAAGAPTCFAEQPDGKVLVGGGFFLVDNNPISYLARLNVDSSFDATFNAGGDGPDGIVNTVVTTPAGKIFVGGNFDSYDDTQAQGFVQLNTDGTIDSTFAVGGSNGDFSIKVQAAVLQPDGKIVVAGNFKNGSVLIERLNTDGSVDSTFTATPNTPVNALVLQPDGKILIGGEFSKVDGQSIALVARLNSDGTLDTTFSPPTGGVDIIAMALQPNGQVLLATAALGVIRVNTDGSLDSSYGPEFAAPASLTPKSLIALPDGSALLGGNYIPGLEQATQYFLKLSSNGAIDTSFNPQLNVAPTALLVRSNGEIYIGGPFSTDITQNAVGVVRFSPAPYLLLGTVTASPSGAITAGTPVTLTASASSIQGQITSVLFQESTDNINFTSVALATNSSGNQWTGQWTPTVAGNYYLRTLATDSVLDSGASVAVLSLNVSPGASPPQITTQPQDQTVALGDTANFSVVASGSGLNYQWQFNNNPISGQTASTLTLNNVTANQRGSYNVIVSNTTGIVASSSAALIVQETFADWEAFYGITGNPTDIPQHDGVTLQLKYLFDLDPTRYINSSDQAVLPVVGLTAGHDYLTMIYRLNSLFSGMTVNVQTATNLQSPQTVIDPDITVLSIDPTTNDETLLVLVPVAGKQQYIRLQLTTP